MKDNFESGWLANLSRTFTENFDLRPPNSDVYLIIIHCISLPPGHYGGNFISQFFTNRLDFKADSYFNNLKGIKHKRENSNHHHGHSHDHHHDHGHGHSH